MFIFGQISVSSPPCLRPAHPPDDDHWTGAHTTEHLLEGLASLGLTEEGLVGSGTLLRPENREPGTQTLSSGS